MLADNILHCLPSSNLPQWDHPLPGTALPLLHAVGPTLHLPNG
jgi:hypothetical protein